MNLVYVALLTVATVLIQCLIGGTRLLFSLPAYGILATAGLLTLISARRNRSTPDLFCLGSSAVLFTYVLARAAYSPVDYLWWTDFYMVLGCLVVYLLTAFYITDTRLRTVVIVALLALALFEVGIGMRQFRFGDNWMPFGFIRADTGRRASGTLISSIHFAGYLEAIAAFALSYTVWSKWALEARIGLGFVAALCYTGVAISGSRGAYISVAVSWVAFMLISLYAIRRVRPQRFAAALTITVALAVVGVTGAATLMSKSPALAERLTLLGQQFEKGKLDVRIYNWQAALDQFRVSPVIGTGAGTHIFYGRLFRRPQIQADPIHAHSDYLEMVAEYGLIGLVGVIIFVYGHVNSSLGGMNEMLDRDLREQGDWGPARNTAVALQIGALTAVASYLAHSVMDFNLHVPGNALFFAFVFGIMANPSAIIHSGRTATVSRAFRWILPVLSLWIVIVGLPKLPTEYFTEKARVALREEKFEESITFAERALQYGTRNPDLFFHLGGANRGLAITTPGAMSRRPYLEAAATAFARGLSIFPQDVHMLVRYAQTLEELGRLQEAGDAYENAVALDPNVGHVHVYYARFLSRVGRKEEAEEHLKKSRALAHEDLSSILRGSPLGPGDE